MPLKPVPPRKGKSPNWSIRGTYRGVYVEKSCGTDRRSDAVKMLRDIERAIDRKEYPPQAPVPRSDGPTFLSAALAYLEAGHSTRYVNRLIRHFGETPLQDIGQREIDDCAAALHPLRGPGTPATRNRCVYTPAFAILTHAGVKHGLKKPSNSKGRTLTDALEPDDAFAIVAAAGRRDLEYQILLKFLLYTGCRLGEALSLLWDSVRLEEGTARIRMSKNGDPREIVLRADVVAALREHPRRKSAGRVFRFRQGGWLKLLLLQCKLEACGLPPIERPAKGEKRRVPPHRLAWVNHHSFCHTWATWMRRYGGADLQGLVATKRWRDMRSAQRYAHVVAREEWGRVEKLPAPDSWKNRGNAS